MAVYVSGKQAQQKSNHDNALTERVFEIGQSVMVRNYREGSKWVPGVIIENTGPVSYVVKTSDGLVWRRHVDQIREYVSEQMSASRNLTSVPQSDDEYGPTLPLQEETVEPSPTRPSPASESEVVEHRYPRHDRRPPDRYSS